MGHGQTGYGHVSKMRIQTQIQVPDNGLMTIVQ